MSCRLGARRLSVAVLMALLGLLASPIGSSAAATAGDTGVQDASTGGGAAQTEQTIAVDPTDPSQVLIGYISGLAVSHDGGLTWKRAPVSCAGDNNPAYDGSGVAYFECDNNGVEYYRSTDKGDTWTGPLSAVGFFENQGDLVDRPWLVRGNDAKTLVVGCESFFSNPVGWVYLKVSNDGGTTWGPPRRVDDQNGHPAMQDPRQLPVVGADGTVYVVYASGQGPFLDCRNCGALPTDYVVARSSDGGATFQWSVAAANVARTAAPTEESEAISSLAADPDPARAKHLALAWSDERSGESRILLVTSVDGGATWSSPVDVADDPPGNGIEHDHPQIQFAPDGRLIVVWRDRRCCGTGWSAAYQIFARALSSSDNGDIVPGQTVQVTDTPQQPNSSSSADEYLGLSVGAQALSVAWNQPRAGAAATTYRRLPLPAAATVAPGTDVPEGAPWQLAAAGLLAVLFVVGRRRRGGRLVTT
jgi:hypothetical protein